MAAAPWKKPHAIMLYFLPGTCRIALSCTAPSQITRAYSVFLVDEVSNDPTLLSGHCPYLDRLERNDIPEGRVHRFRRPYRDVSLAQIRISMGGNDCELT
jgi:hypothetical protein